MSNKRTRKLHPEGGSSGQISPVTRTVKSSKRPAQIKPRAQSRAQIKSIISRNPTSVTFVRKAANPCDQAKYTLAEINDLKAEIKSCVDSIDVTKKDTEENKKSDSEGYFTYLETLNNITLFDYLKKNGISDKYKPYIAANLIQRDFPFPDITDILIGTRHTIVPNTYPKLFEKLGYADTLDADALEDFLNIYSFGKNRNITKILAESKKIYYAIDKLKKDKIYPDYGDLFLLPKQVELIEDINKLLYIIKFVNLEIPMSRLTIYKLMNIKKVLSCLIIIEDLIQSWEKSDEKRKAFHNGYFIAPCLLLQNIYLFLFIFLLSYPYPNSGISDDDDLLKRILIICLIIDKGGIFQVNKPIQINTYPILFIFYMEGPFYTLSKENITENILNKIHFILAPENRVVHFSQYLNLTQTLEDPFRIINHIISILPLPSSSMSKEIKLVEKHLGTQEEVGTYQTDLIENHIESMFLLLGYGAIDKSL